MKPLGIFVQSSWLLLRNLNQATIIPVPYGLLYMQILPIKINFNSNPVICDVMKFHALLRGSVWTTVLFKLARPGPVLFRFHIRFPECTSAVVPGTTFGMADASSHAGHCGL